MKTLLFLYGTLKRGCRNHHLMAGQTFVGSAQTAPRYRLHDCGSYPALVDATDGRSVHGELWQVDAAMLTRLDEFEEVDHTFARREVAVAGVGEPVFAYFYCGDVSALADCGAEWRGN